MIASRKARFVSRGDNSGTHKKERELWKSGQVDPKTGSGKWYLETGSGMGASLNMASSLDGYILTDRGTWLSFNNKKKLKILAICEIATILLFNIPSVACGVWTLLQLEKYDENG